MTSDELLKAGTKVRLLEPVYPEFEARQVMEVVELVAKDTFQPREDIYFLKPLGESDMRGTVFFRYRFELCDERDDDIPL